MLLFIICVYGLDKNDLLLTRKPFFTINTIQNLISHFLAVRVILQKEQYFIILINIGVGPTGFKYDVI